MRKRNKYKLQGGAVMTFEEIGEQLGITKVGAQLVFNRAIRKLRESGEIEKLRDLALVLEQERAA